MAAREIVTRYGMDPDAYRRALQRTVDSIDALSGDAARHALFELTVLRRGITGEIALGMGTDWSLNNLSRVQTQIDGVLSDWVDRYSKSLAGDLGKAGDLGVDQIPGAIRNGSKAPESIRNELTVPKISRRQLEAAIVGPIPELVQNLSNGARREIGDQMRRAVLGVQTPGETMRNLRSYLATPDRPTGRYGPLAYQAERVFRTEIGRVHGLANRAGMDFTIGRLGSTGFVEVWSHSGLPGARKGHAALDGFYVPQGTPFVVNGFKCKGPHDPVLPAKEVINCRCTSYLWNERWGPPPGGPKPQGTAFFKTPRAKRNGWKRGDRPPGLGARAKGQPPIGRRRPGPGPGPGPGPAPVPTPDPAPPAGPTPQAARSAGERYPKAKDFRRDLVREHRRNVRKAERLSDRAAELERRAANAPAYSSPERARRKAKNLGDELAALRAGDYKSIPEHELGQIDPFDALLGADAPAHPVAVRHRIGFLEKQIADAERVLDAAAKGEKFRTRFQLLDEAKALRREASNLQDLAEGAGRDKLKTGRGLSFKFKNARPPEDLRGAWKEGLDELGDLFDRDAWKPDGFGPGAAGRGRGDSPFEVPFKTHRGRAFFDPDTNVVNVDGRVRAVIHETGHWFEYNNPEAKRRAAEFLDGRLSEGEAVRSMGLEYGGELAYRDKFKPPGDVSAAPSWYAGKPYWSKRGYGSMARETRLSGGRTSPGMTPGQIAQAEGVDLPDLFLATEVLSMGLEYYWNNPIRFALEDPDYFDFIYSLVRGTEWP